MQCRKVLLIIIEYNRMYFSLNPVIFQGELLLNSGMAFNSLSLQQLSAELFRRNLSWADAIGDCWRINRYLEAACERQGAEL